MRHGNLRLARALRRVGTREGTEGRPPEWPGATGARTMRAGPRHPEGRQRSAPGRFLRSGPSRIAVGSRRPLQPLRSETLDGEQPAPADRSPEDALLASAHPFCGECAERRRGTASKPRQS
ncbi:hypothetical protein F8B43_2123 [Methylorubrum populi]|uniref:Uncharacterized protein n=1 Tax=Methylorubrum populi TaxID=223967 RepID=A0A833MXW0_9HYPH|nr:hypothetical protein F8B43_2123 [Methylorubrum populi]